MDGHWVLCPVCSGKTRLKLLPDTVLENYPLYCPKCKNEVLINARSLQITIAHKKSASDNSN